MARKHRFDKTQWQARKDARDQVRNNPGKENSVPELREAVRRLERAAGYRSPRSS